MGKKIIIRAGVFLFCVCFLYGCGRHKPAREEIIATINNEPVYVKDFDRVMAFTYKNDPLLRRNKNAVNDQLAMLIDKKLLIQEARHKKIDQEEKFVATIKSFWEQTLIRDIIDLKEAEFAREVTVSDEEVRSFYDTASFRITFSLRKDTNKDELQRLMSAPSESISWEEEVGPVAGDEASSGLMLKIFRIPAGRKQIIEDGGQYYLVYVQKKEKSAEAAPPYETMRDTLRKKILDIRVQDRFSQWMASLKEKAAVSVNDDVVKKLKFRE